MGVLDDAISNLPAQSHIVTSMRVDRLLANLSANGLPADDLDRLHAMLRAPVEEWGHTALVRVLRHCCDELNVAGPDAAQLNYKNVEDYRKKMVR